jgi:hypothetical protein
MIRGLVIALLAAPLTQAEACKYAEWSPKYDRAYDVGEAPRPGACEQGNPWDCEKRGLTGEILPALERACWLGDPEACYLFSERLWSTDPDRAEFFFAASCQGVFHSACWQSAGCDQRSECRRWAAACCDRPSRPVRPPTYALGAFYFSLGLLLALLSRIMAFCHRWRRHRPPPPASP